MHHKLKQFKQAVVTAPICPYCGTEARSVNASVVYGPKYHQLWIWVCGRFPACDSYVGCHHYSKVPLGTMANSDLRTARNRAHKAFDVLWQTSRENKISRSLAYGRLAQYLNLKLKDTHIGLFTLSQCEKVLEFVKSFPQQNAGQ